ncbi:Uncharacterised protein [Salmonella enterica subsp. enterica serovar Bovismorbificans]|uniref:Uncharacterized protein n=1 Tax=Salmonella enterica subsp. enterica serovar Bovismorbificans TaxID=58097 RepID=A0A655CIR6_SALET|nr:Uncharacterised protein [Salmonella enterica subsp. enterica serovar Bovismorbificans]
MATRTVQQIRQLIKRGVLHFTITTLPETDKLLLQAT